MASISNEEIENILQNLVDDDFHGESCSEDGEISEVGDNLSIHSEEEDEIGADDISDDDNDPVNPTKALLKGKNGHIWSTVARTSSKTPRRNKICVSIQRLARGAAQNIVTEKDAFTTLLNEEIIDLIVLYTNQEIDRRAPKYENQRYVHKTDSTEFKALIGLLLFSAINKDNRKSANDMWSPFSAAVYKSIMSANRFQFLLNCVRFDDKTQRGGEDPFAAFRQIWELFIANCRNSYHPRFYLTIDEQLLSFRGKCPFRVYIASKPDKYGLKIVTICDAKTYYMFDAIPYIGKRTEQKTAADYVKKLVQTIKGSGRNVTYDNWFASIPLADELLKDYSLTTIGTLRKNKPEIPPCFLAHKRKQPLTSQFAFDQEKTLVSFTPKKNKAVILLSTMHYKAETNPETSKPEIIHDYNATKGGVDTFDKLMHSYTSARRTRRWPLRYFYAMIDQAGINSMVLYFDTNHPNISAAKMRSEYLKKVALQLARPHMERRLQTILPRELASSIRDILGITKEVSADEPPQKSQKQARCALCPRNRDKKVKAVCEKCHLPTCPEHRKNLCLTCI
ncbi:piggyBac transposable element-derived protein 4-like [Bactrocera tryoni]|uniref:piggyBac transposable element-derived protein 4-like n=1 Tax=Bactrocera tryoni TaxID=59916 RepID=UPI001A9654CB|nr:piggyBac transposable element-derived protein 4-like [Bactrocera tryoni]